MLNKILGAFLVLLTVLGIWLYTQESRPDATPSNAVSSSPTQIAPSANPTSNSRPAQAITRVRGYVGGEKMGLVQNPRVQKILSDTYGIEFQADRRGSVEMVTTEPLEGIDVLWPGSQSQSELYARSGRPRLAEEVLFVSPIVIYSWDLVQTALTAKGIVSEESGIYYVINMSGLLSAVTTRTKWGDLGVPQLFGSIKVAFTDPRRSNSGAQYLALSGTVLSGNDSLGLAELPSVTPQLRRMVENLGLLQSSSGELFNQYLKQGVGAFPLVAGYENQIIEFAVANPAFAAQIQQKLRLLYPRPTVWSNHPMIALTPVGRRLITALKDPAIQAIAWSEHGLRTEKAAIDPSATPGISGIPPALTAIAPNPTLEVVERLLTEISPPATPAKP